MGGPAAAPRCRRGGARRPSRPAAIRVGRRGHQGRLALGVAPATGAVAELSWPEIAGGVLVTGADAQEVTLTSLQLVHAALRRRKPVIVLDDGHDAGLARALAATCVATGTPLHRGRR